MPSAINATSNDASDAALRLQIAQQKLLADTAAKASAEVLEADRQAVTKAQAAVGRASSTGATYL